MTMVMLLERMGRRGVIASHGFRSVFSAWASEVSPFSSELRESALAHTIGNKAEAAYRRGDALEKRRTMMEAWRRGASPRGRMSWRSRGRPMSVNKASGGPCASVFGLSSTTNSRVACSRGQLVGPESMFPKREPALSIQEISEYWSREIVPPASREELRSEIEKAWWRGDLVGRKRICGSISSGQSRNNLFARSSLLPRTIRGRR